MTRGEVFRYPEAVPLLLQAYGRVTMTSGDAPTAALSLEEKRLCALAVAGYGARSIVERLRLSPRAGDAARAELMAELGLRQRSGVVALAARAGLLPAPAQVSAA